MNTKIEQLELKKKLISNQIKEEKKDIWKENHRKYMREWRDKFPEKYEIQKEKQRLKYKRMKEK